MMKEKDPDEILWGKFVVVEERHNSPYGTLCTVYDKNTKVMYFIVLGYDKIGISPIYNSDGTVKIYDEEGNNGK